MWVGPFNRQDEVRPGEEIVLDKISESVIGDNLAGICWLSALRTDNLPTASLLKLDVAPQTLRADCIPEMFHLEKRALKKGVIIDNTTCDEHSTRSMQ